MAWAIKQASASDIASTMTSFESGVTSVDDFSATSIGRNRVVVLIKYTP